jgi:type IV secretion system protein VirD4
MIRELRFGYGLMLLRSAKPIMLRLHPWTGRPDAGKIKTGKARIETAIRETAAREWESGSESEP